MSKVVSLLPRLASRSAQRADDGAWEPPDSDFDESPPRIGPPVPFDEAVQDLVVAVSDTIGVQGWLTNSLLQGDGPRPVELTEVELMTVTATDCVHRLTVVGRAVAPNGHQDRVRITAEESTSPHPDDFLAPMHGSYEWLADEDAY